MTVLRPLLVVWVGLLVLLAIEATGGRLLHAGLLTPVIGLCMAAVVALALMRAGDGPPPIRLFVFFGLFWVVVLLGLGMMTR